MKSMKTVLYAAALLGGTLLQATPSFAQATRTWVSGGGDDINPCSRTAPCKTFAGALSKTAAGGEINCLDPAGYGAVTINKSLTIDCHFTEGGVLASGNGIVVNALSTDVVILRGLDLFGVSPPTHGLRILVAAAVVVEDCTIRQWNAAGSYGISFQPSALTRLYVSNSHIVNNGNGTGGGILVQPTGSGVGQVTLVNTEVKQNSGNGILMDSTGNTGGIAVVMQNSNVSGTTGNGVSMLQGGAAVTAMITDSIIAHNSMSGIVSNGLSSTARVGNTTITGNSFTSGAGVTLLNGGKVQTYLDNRLDGNAVDGAFTSPNIAKK